MLQAVTCVVWVTLHPLLLLLCPYSTGTKEKQDTEAELLAKPPLFLWQVSI